MVLPGCSTGALGINLARGNPADACDRPGLLVETARQCLAGAITIHPAGLRYRDLVSLVALFEAITVPCRTYSRSSKLGPEIYPSAF
eukprot:symbB.v1.2.020432.t1/scaffold1721.1/size104744/1